VSDTGVGMDAETVEHAFEPFFTTKSDGKGTGLGLATIYGIVTQSGGRVSLYSEPGVGTTVTTMQPATDQDAAARDRSVVQEQGGHGEVILMVEDEDGIRAVAMRILTRRGYRVLAAANGPEALEIARDHAGQIDLLITDVIMPRMLGREVAQRVTAARPTVRVMFMSGYAEPILDSNANVPDGIILLEKPFTEQQLLATVRRALSSAAAS
jgi:CheY-like chemotaxis protein